MGGFWWAHQALVPLFLLLLFNYSESYIYHYDNMYSSYLDLKCLLCVYVTVKIQFGNTSTHEYSYLPLCSVAMLDHTFGSPYSEILDPPLYISSLFKFFVSSLSYCEVYTSTEYFEVHCYHVFYIYMYQTSVIGLKIKCGLKIARTP